MQTKKRKKNIRERAKSTHGWGARKKHKKSGHRGGTGMAGTGKRADQRKTLVTKLHGSKYFGKQGITSKGTQKDKSENINLRSILSNIENYVRKGLAKKKGDSFELELNKHKILGEGNINAKLVIRARAASKSAIEKVKKAGGEIQLPEFK